MTEQDQDVEHRSGGWRSRWITKLGGAGLAAAAVVLLVVGGVAVFAPDDQTQVVSGDPAGSSVTTTTAGAEDPCVGDTVVVHLNPTATPAEVSGVEAALSTFDEVEAFEFMDRAETYAEFQRLFEDQPDFVAAITPEELPQSFRVSLTSGWDPQRLSEWGTLPGVLRIDLADQQPSEGSVPDRIEC